MWMFKTEEVFIQYIACLLEYLHYYNEQFRADTNMSIHLKSILNPEIYKKYILHIRLTFIVTMLGL